ncbi:hypothetical protein PFY12_00580 [Chryseobacterium camelliae]|uniref:MarR family transcriptional regulator n=1 Tax=Chryseobacterium camelliae TaxID=1265445 RepID=A0ABY7QN84_9FLAO|nr:hypothetical protein [Chryseobacterium camelliae]WBV60629.1 hypothetical protein PFY12_00580 [Chryseobacterium camelliae]
MKTNDPQRWFDFLDEIDGDPQLNVWHIALLIAIARLACKQKEKWIIRVSRSKLMAYSHIGTITSYHKYFNQLQKLGYIKYTPSYHPDYRSTVEILRKQKMTQKK